MNPNQWVNNMLNDPQNQIPPLQMLNSSSSSNPNTPSSANSVTSNTHQLPSFPNQFATFNSPFANFTPDQFILWQQLQLQQQLSQTQISQQQSQQRTLYRPLFTQPQFSQQQSEAEQPEFIQQSPPPQQTEVGPSDPNPKGGRCKTQATKPREKKTDRSLWTQEEELILAECYIQISEDPIVGNNQQNDTFWYKVLDEYNEQAKRKGLKERNKNMLTGKWTTMNREVGKFNSVFEQTLRLSGENDEDLMTRVHILYKDDSGKDFAHKGAWLFLRDKHKWRNPYSTQLH